MTIPAQLKSLVKPSEDLLWHSPAVASDRLSDYGGVHELIGRLFLGLSMIMALIFFVGMQNAGQMGLSIPLLVFVAGPVVIGLTIRQVGRRRARRIAKSTYFGVTSHHILSSSEAGQDSVPIQADTIANIASTTPDRDVLEYANPASGNAPARDMTLPHGEAEKAQAVINLVKASL